MEALHVNYFNKLLGDENVYSDKAHLLAYSYDATRNSYEPDLVLFPRNEEDVQAILRYCNEHKIIITPRAQAVVLQEARFLQMVELFWLLKNI